MSPHNSDSDLFEGEPDTRHFQDTADVDFTQDIPGPEVGTYAYTARFMSDLFPDFDWDKWKDEMKDSMYEDDL
jgi:hypothetical protein